MIKQVRKPHPLAGKILKVSKGEYAGKLFKLEDWWQNVSGKSWMYCDGNPACLQYACRSHLPIDNEVVYGKINGFGVLLHVSELSPLGVAK